MPWLKDPLTQMESQQLFHCCFFKDEFFPGNWKEMLAKSKLAKEQDYLARGFDKKDPDFRTDDLILQKDRHCKCKGDQVSLWFQHELRNWTGFSGIGKLNVILEGGLYLSHVVSLRTVWKGSCPRRATQVKHISSLVCCVILMVESRCPGGYCCWLLPIKWLWWTGEIQQWLQLRLPARCIC